MNNTHVRVGVAVLMFKDGKFLMGKRKGSHGSDTWAVPGGHLEFGESPEETAKREVLEEVGAEISDIMFAGITNDIFNDEHKHYITIWLAAKYVGGDVTILEPQKCSELSWFDFDNLPSPLFFPWQQLLKSDFIAHIKQLSK